MRRVRGDVRQSWIVWSEPIILVRTSTTSLNCVPKPIKGFKAVTSNPDHVLHQLLSPVKDIPYHLRTRAHNFELPDVNSLPKKCASMLSLSAISFILIEVTSSMMSVRARMLDVTSFKPLTISKIIFAKRFIFNFRILELGMYFIMISCKWSEIERSYQQKTIVKSHMGFQKKLKYLTFDTECLANSVR